jgi:hypothetical protein
MARAQVVFSNGETFDVPGKSAAEVVAGFAGQDFIIFPIEYRQYSYWNRAALVKVYDLEPEGGG